MKLAPCLLIAFLRPHGTLKVMEECISAGVNRVYLSVDGPRTNSEKQKQESLVTSAKELAERCGIALYVLHHSQNLGVGLAIRSALDWFFDQEEMGIVLEDDLEIHPDFFEFATGALLSNLLSGQVRMVSGNQFFQNNLEVGQRQWTNYPLIWGWGTTSDSWKEFRKAYFSDLELQFATTPRVVQNFLAIGRKRALIGTVDSWAIPLSAYMRSQGFHCQLPPQNLVKNVGTDELATHTRVSDTFVHAEVAGLGSGQVQTIPNQDGIDLVNKIIEKDLYKIRFRHYFLPVYDILFRYFRTKTVNH